MKFGWDDELATGHREIDGDHRNLLQIIDRLEALAGVNDRGKIEEILCDLTNHIIVHFGREENLMIQSKYPDYENHMLLHSQFFARLTQFVYMFEGSSWIPGCCPRPSWCDNRTRGQ